MATNVYSRRLYLNADKTEVLEEGDEGAAYLLGGEGSPVADEDVEKYGLTKKHFRAADEPAEEQGIVVSGTRDGGPGFVKAEAGAQTEAEPPAKTSTKAAAKKGK